MILSAPNPFQTLVSDLSKILVPSSGLDPSDINVQEMQKLLEDYTSSEQDWEKYAFADLSRVYTRNLVGEGNGKSNLLILVWTPNKGSPIHDHAGAHCLMKILKGTLKETRFDYPPKDTTVPKVIKETLYHQVEVTYMADDLGLHKVSNPDEKELAVSLHRKPEPPSMTATEFEREVYKRALAEWEESHGFIKRFAERQAGGRLLSVNDEKYRKLVEEFRAAQKMGSTSAAAGSDSGVQSVVAVKKEEKSGSRWFGGLKRKMRGVVRT
ncbi:hypothetical protein IFR05_011410 [Cadophora sp. M221]|nr:hypothetical protein IFR05_011410 [Cadophora sp. M221]